MDKILPELRKQYEMWKRQIDDSVAGPRLVSGEEVLRAHYLLADYFLREGEDIAAPGPRDVNLMMSAVGRQKTGYGGRDKWQQDVEVCATLFFGLVKNHAFHDGNKRTAFLTAIYHLDKCGRTLAVPQKDFEKLALATAAGRLDQFPKYKRFVRKRDPEVRTIADFFQKKTRKVDARYYTVTFRQLDAILRRYGYYFANLIGNHIDVVREVEERYGFLRRKRRTVRKKVVQVGCPSMSKEVNVKALKSILRTTGLTPENGYDSQVVFKGADPLEVLIPKSVSYPPWFPARGSAWGGPAFWHRLGAAATGPRRSEAPLAVTRRGDCAPS